ncbi:MAG: hypothetical protein II921_05125 [Treponema sp.]|nr:hypothetical protein [Treponema sp.]
MKISGTVKIKVFAAVLMFCTFFAFSEIYSSHELVPADSWIYDALCRLNLENASSTVVETAPLSVEELRFHFSLIDYDSLSDSGKNLYKKVDSFLNTKGTALNLGPVHIGFNAIVDFELMVKTNDDIDWTFATDYAGNTDYFGVEREFGAASNYEGNDLTNPFIKFRFAIDFADYVVIELDPFWGKSFWGLSDDKNVTNFPVPLSDMEFLQPTTAYASTGHFFGSKKFGFNLHIAKEGLQIGRTKTGSIIYNDTYQTDAYVQLNLYTQKFKYEMNVAEVDSSKFLYLHSIHFSPNKYFRVGFLEGTQLTQPFEIRYLNPLMIMHSFGSWTEYNNPIDTSEHEDRYGNKISEEEKYGEAWCCAYFAATLDVVPTKNLRLYSLFAMNEFQLPFEKDSETGASMPNSFAIQLGFEYNIPESHGGYYVTNFEATYNSPYMYMKQGEAWSLYRKRYNMQRDSTKPICSWMGSPFGPDALAFSLSVGYDKPGKWNAELNYLCVAHGENSFALFQSKDDLFYPSVLWNTSYLSAGDAESLANHFLNGTVQYTHQITLKGRYELNEHVALKSQFTYSLVFNNDNKSDEFACGAQISVGCEAKLFK